MVIWILDCVTCYCTKVRLSAEREKELEENYLGVYEFILAHENEFGVCVENCSWMVADEELYDEIDF